MFGKAVSGVMLTLLLIVMLTFAFNIQPAKAEPTTIIVPDDYPTIQEAINHAYNGDTIYVKAGTYYENVVINKALKVVGDDHKSIIYGTFFIETDDVLLRGFKINGGLHGVILKDVKSSSIFDNIIYNNTVGILSYHSINILQDFHANIDISKNLLYNNDYGILISYDINLATENYKCAGYVIRGNCFRKNFHSLYFNYSINLLTLSDGDFVTFGGNVIVANNFENNSYVIEEYIENINLLTTSGRISLELGRNEIFNNNFVFNEYLRSASIRHIGTWNTDVFPPQDGIKTAFEFWDHGYPYGGNYWHNYHHVDENKGFSQDLKGSDGILDKPYQINLLNKDNYPLAGRVYCFYANMPDGLGDFFYVVSNSTIEDFEYFDSNHTIVMHVSNMTADQKAGFCRLTIPHELMLPPYVVKVNGTEVEYETIYENYTEGISIIYFAYEHSMLEIAVIPEFPLTTLLLTFLMFLTILIIFTKKTQDQKSLTST